MLCWFLMYRKVIELYIHCFQIIFHCSLLKDTEYSSLCCTVGCCLFYIVCWSQTHLIYPPATLDIHFRIQLPSEIMKNVCKYLCTKITIFMLLSIVKNSRNNLRATDGGISTSSCWYRLCNSILI